MSGRTDVLSAGHLMQDRGGSSARPLHHILAEGPSDQAGRLTYGGRGPRTSLLCGGFALGSGLPDNLLSLLPPLLVLDAAGTGGGPWTRWLEPAFLMLREEGARDAPGASARTRPRCPRRSGARSVTPRASTVASS